MFKKLLGTSRPLTGVFAALLTVIGFRYFNGVPEELVVATAATFLGITWSIMSFNDWVDRNHDVKKGKIFAKMHEGDLKIYLLHLSGQTMLLVSIVLHLDVKVGLFLMGVWSLGIIYSYIPHWYLVNNLIVALCSGSPVLVGVVYTGSFKYEPLLLFATFVFFILIREVYKDMEDASIDRGHKATMPVKRGNLATTMYLVMLTLLLAGCLRAYGNAWLVVIGYATTLLAWFHAMMFSKTITSPGEVLKNVNRAKNIMDWMMRVVIIATLVTQ